MADIKFQDAFDLFAKTLKEDSGLYYAYQSNIAVAFQDELSRRGYKLPDQHEISNQAAKEFLDHWISKSENDLRREKP